MAIRNAVAQSRKTLVEFWIATTVSTRQGNLPGLRQRECDADVDVRRAKAPCPTLPRLADEGVELAEISHSGHFPMYSNPVQMRCRITDFVLGTGQ